MQRISLKSSWLLLASIFLVRTMHALDLRDSRLPIDVEVSIKDAGKVGAEFIQGMGKNIDIEKVSSSLFENFGKGLGGLGKGGSYALNEIATELGFGLRKNFGENSTFVDDLSTASRGVGRGLSSFLDGVSDRLVPFVLKYGASTAGAILLMTTSYYGTKTFWNIVYHRYINPTPRVIISSSKDISWYQGFKNRIFGKPALPKMIFSQSLKDRLEKITQATRNITAKIALGKTNIHYRNILLYGPPGTGKTMFAWQLAQQSGMDFAMVTGSSFFQERAGILAIDELFAWAKKSKKGLCLFIDEADSLLSTRENMNSTTQNYRIVNHFLNYLGERSNKFMVILATNYPATFDEAMQRRIDDAIEMPLPAEKERFETLCYYRDLVLADVKQNGKPFVITVQSCLTDAKIYEIAKATEGFSYADLQGLINTLKSEADITKEGLITTSLIDDVVVYAFEKKQAFIKKLVG